MRVLVPAVKDDETRVVWKPTKLSETLVEKYKEGDTKNMLVLMNKPPTWNEQTKSFMLNFQNRVKQASVKNFQVIDENKRNILLYLS